MTKNPQENKKTPFISQNLGDSDIMTQELDFGLDALRQYLVETFGGEIQEGEIVHPSNMSN